jgi:elongation factor Ts
VSDGLGKIGVLVGLESKGKSDALGEFGRKLAMHVAASNPQSVDSHGLDKSVIDRERSVLAEKARATGKPENVIEKIVDSGLKTFYKEVCLVDQAYVHDPAKSVAQALKEAESQAGGPIKIAGFLRYALGEGVEKQEQDFAAEVAAAAKPN